MNELIRQLMERRGQVVERMEAIVNGAADETRNLSAEEDTEWQQLREELEAIDNRLAELREVEERNRVAAEAARAVSGGSGGPDAGGRVQVLREPLTYERHNPRISYFRDLGLAMVGRDSVALEGLQRHAREMAVEFPKFARENSDHPFTESREKRERFDRWVREAQAQIEHRDLSRTDGAGGEFVPPLWLMELFAEVPRSGRVFADRVRNIPLPGGTDSINIPRITAGAATGVQTGDHVAVAETDATTNSVEAPVRTIAGQQDIALQLLEQSPVVFDEIIFADLTDDYDEQLDDQCLNGSGASGQVRGIRNVTGINAVTYTDTTPTVPELYPKGADAVNQVASNRKRPPTAQFMHPRRWFWMTAALDGQNRPLVVPVAYGAFSPAAVMTDVLAEGPVGSWHGLPVYIDPQIPINLGAGTNEDVMLTTRLIDHILFEGVLRTRALPEVLSGQLAVRLQVYAYVAFTAGRHPNATSTITGTGLVTPTF